jgi:hypothetical protein
MTSALINLASRWQHSPRRFPALKILRTAQEPQAEYFSSEHTNKSSQYKKRNRFIPELASAEKAAPSARQSANSFPQDACAITEDPASQFTLGSIESVKIAFRWRILNDRTLVRNELRIKASCYTDISIFSVAFEARIWLYVGLCCDAGGLDSGPVPAVATHRSFPTRMN